MNNTQKDQKQESLRSFTAGLQSLVSGKLDDIWWFFMLRGVLAGVLGICALIWPTISLGVLTVLVGIYCMADGLAGLVGAIRSTKRSTYLLQALISLVAGAVLVFGPRESIRTLLMVFGAWALFTGVSQIIAARRTDDDVTDRGLMTTVGGITAVVGLVLLVWPGAGIVTISWVIAVALLLLAGLLIFLAIRLKRFKARVDKLTVSKPNPR